jgi:hypothetical protein
LHKNPTKLFMNRHMASCDFGRGSVVYGLGPGTGHQDYPLPMACPPGIMFNGVNRTRPTRCPQATIPSPGIVRIFSC